MNEIRADFSGAIRKTAMMKQLPRAQKYVATEWAADTIRILKARTREMRKSVGRFKKKTGQLGRSLGFMVGASEDKWTLAVGTGLPGHVTSAYALIQDRGGTTHPKVTKRMRRWAWFMYGETGEDMYKGIALTKKSTLTVNLKPTAWFSDVLAYRERDLTEMMRPEHVIKVAQGMSGV